MERGHATLVQRVGIRARIDEVPDQLTLCSRIPVLRARIPVGGIVERFRASSVSNSHISALRDEQLGELSLMRRGSDVQRGVAAVHVVTDPNKEVRVRILAARPDVNRAACEIVG
jgi:hypothetical protein